MKQIQQRPDIEQVYSAMFYNSFLGIPWNLSQTAVYDVFFIDLTKKWQQIVFSVSGCK